jgi:hypothetical protein
MSDASPKLVLSMTAETLEKMIADEVAAAMGGGNQQATSSAALARSENAASTAHAHTSGDNLAEPASPGAVVIAETKSDTVAERKAGMADLVALESFGATTELLQELQGTAHAQNTAHLLEAIATIAEPATSKDSVVKHTSENAASPPPGSRNALTPTTECDDLLSSPLASAKPSGDGILSEVMRQRADDVHHGRSSWETTTGARTNHAPPSFSREEFYLDSATTILTPAGAEFIKEATTPSGGESPRSRDQQATAIRQHGRAHGDRERQEQRDQQGGQSQEPRGTSKQEHQDCQYRVHVLYIPCTLSPDSTQQALHVTGDRPPAVDASVDEWRLYMATEPEGWIMMPHVVYVQLENERHQTAVPVNSQGQQLQVLRSVPADPANVQPPPEATEEMEMKPCPPPAELLTESPPSPAPSPPPPTSPSVAFVNAAVIATTNCVATFPPLQPSPVPHLTIQPERKSGGISDC